VADEAPVPSRIILADDHPLFRAALRHLLTQQGSALEVVAEATDGPEALELCRRFGPDLVLMDLSMPKLDGIETTREIKRELPRTVVLIMTASADPSDLAAALKAGAAGYVLKTATPEQITDAILRVLEGESPLNQELAMELLLKKLMEEAPKEEERTALLREESPPAPPRRKETSLPASLSPRELEVLRLVARGLTNQQIAKELHISVSTVKKRVQRIISKLKVSDRTQAAVRAIEMGLHSDPEDE
jgi:DNA-binding NarL/FixJ family response regulator